MAITGKATKYGDPCWSRPLFRWAGSKRRQLPLLLGRRPANFRRYIEPFAGSACLFFALHPSKALLGDNNAELVDAYKVIRSHPRQVAQRLLTWPNTKRFYYSLRKIIPAGLEPIAQAARFMYLNRNCFNGVYRTNKSGQFNVPRGSKTGSALREDEIYRCAFALRSADIVHADFETLLAHVGEGDFVYLDPPYPSKPRPRYGEYGYNCFGPSDVPRLIAALREIDTRGAKFLLSYTSLRGMEAIPREWAYESILVRRHVAGFAANRPRVREVVIRNY